ncbi:hypothetical protein JYJ95_39640 [Corallococcus exiguus]|uniref:hypothetical protein n=1 Tax=Corallococcus exiguus TaxID=83462 RepID=UPI001A8ECC7B|nr:hypothetical protein [Corallococcus exiguus]MBN8472653.1 hypothetical protein [Corallococcus exiguus]
MHSRIPFRFLLVACLAALTAHASTPSASSLPLPTLSVSCVGSSTFTFTPGLKNEPRDITHTANVDLPNCVLLPSLQRTTAAAPTKTQLFPGLTCTDLLKPFARTEATFSWGDGGTSKVVLSQTRVEAQGASTVLVGVGSVTEGKYKGAVAVRTLTYVNEDVTQGCLSEQGLTQTSGPATLTLTLPQ